MSEAQKTQPSLPKKSLEVVADSDKVAPSFPLLFRQFVIQYRFHIMAAITGFILVSSLLLMWWQYSRPTSELTPAAQQTGSPTPSPIPEEPGITVAVVGYGGAGHEGSYLTDSILLVRVLLEQKRVLLFSLPRDLWVESTSKEGKTQNTKINAVYTLNGPGELKKVLQTVTGWKVDKIVGIDFSGFTQAIDTLGGVSLSVERTFDDYEYPIQGREDLICEDMFAEDSTLVATAQVASDSGVVSIADEIAAGKIIREELPKNVKEFPCRYEHLHFDAGKQTLTGVQALKFARSRHSLQDGNDFGRSRRQQLMVQSLRDQVLTPDFVPKIPAIYKNLRSHITTDFSALEITEWIGRALDLRSYPITSLALSDKNYVVLANSADRQSILRPQMGEGQWANIHDWLRFAATPTMYSLSSPVVEISTSAKNRALADELRLKIESQLRLPVFISTDGKAVSASVSAQIKPLIDGIDEDAMRKISELAQGSVMRNTDTSSPPPFNGPHVRIEFVPISTE